MGCVYVPGEWRGEGDAELGVLRPTARTRPQARQLRTHKKRRRERGLGHWFREGGEEGKAGRDGGSVGSQLNVGLRESLATGKTCGWIDNLHPDFATLRTPHTSIQRIQHITYMYNQDTSAV